MEKPKYTEIKINEYVKFEELAEAIISQTGITNVTFSEYTHDYRTIACILTDSFMISLSESLLRRVVEIRKENQRKM
jgi:hypothetical protein